MVEGDAGHALYGYPYSLFPDYAAAEDVYKRQVLSAALAIRRGAHIRMTAFDVYLPKIAVKVLDILADLAAVSYTHLCCGPPASAGPEQPLWDTVPSGTRYGGGAVSAIGGE